MAPGRGSNERPTARFVKSSRRHVRRAFKGLMRSHKVKIPKYDMPVRIRPWFVVLTVLVMLILAFLGFTNLSHKLPVNDKLLHFSCLGIATAVFYFVFDVEEDARRIWFWRFSPLIFTGFVCFLLGGIVSEIVQSLLPYKQFEFGDIVANLLGSGIGLYISYNLEKYYRHRREINRLYRPLGGSGDSINLAYSDDELMEDDIDLESGLSAQLPSTTRPGPVRLPTTPKIPGLGVNGNGNVGGKKVRNGRAAAMDNVWDEREELFGVGDDEGFSDDDERTPLSVPSIKVSSAHDDGLGHEGGSGSGEGMRGY